MKVRAVAMTVIFALLVSTIAIINAVLPKKNFSENERSGISRFS